MKKSKHINRIHHLLPGDIDHLSLDIILSLESHSKLKHHFGVVNFEKEKRLKILKKLESLPGLSFEIIDEQYARRFFHILSILMGYRAAQVKKEAAIMRYLYKNRKKTLLSHFYLKPYVVLFLFKKYVWVCWGNIPSLNNQIKSLVFTRFLFPRLNIITLMTSDKAKLIQNYNADIKKIKVLNYCMDHYRNLISTKYEKIENTKVKLLLGNNSNHLTMYYDAIDILFKFKENISVYAMLSYGNATKKDIDSFNVTAGQFFNSDYHPVNEFFNYEEYILWLKQFDVYFCPVSTQSGLGVIYIMLYLGKKVFLTGHNLKWCRHNGLTVFDIELLNHLDIDSLSCLKKEEIKLNRNVIKRMLSPEVTAAQWDEFVISIMNNRD